MFTSTQILSMETVNLLIFSFVTYTRYQKKGKCCHHFQKITMLAQKLMFSSYTSLFQPDVEL